MLTRPPAARAVAARACRLQSARLPSSASLGPALQLRELTRYSTIADFTDLSERNCIHCHQVGRAEALELRASGEPMADAVLFPWPTPDVFGLSLAADRCGTVTGVAKGSAAAHAGFEVGDEIRRFAGQPIVSVADVQWVLHRASEPCALPVTVDRGGKSVELTLKLTPGWRRSERPSWRMRDRHLSLADLPRLGLGGVPLRPLNAAEREKLAVGSDSLALEVGFYRGRGRQREGGGGGESVPLGLEAGDVLVAFDGVTAAMTEMDVLAHCVQKRKAGDEVPATVLRAGSRVELQLRLR